MSTITAKCNQVLNYFKLLVGLRYVLLILFCITLYNTVIIPKIIATTYYI